MNHRIVAILAFIACFCFCLAAYHTKLIKQAERVNRTPLVSAEPSECDRDVASYHAAQEAAVADYMSTNPAIKAQFLDTVGGKTRGKTVLLDLDQMPPPIGLLIIEQLKGSILQIDPRGQK